MMLSARAIQEQVQQMASVMREQFYDELDEIICNCMAAGVPASQFVVPEPEMEVEGTSVSLQGYIGFKPTK